ncbi:MAG TPA: glycosyltransferase family 1 protein [Candidatus Kaiserbacteria bacterium]|nr:glycosyltransferase family 1 protein [Candidatus Kaiserbacteria bacterium]
MKRILIFSLAYYPVFVSGAEAAIKEITDRITPEDIEFHMITMLFDRSSPRDEIIGNVHVHRVGFGGAYISKILFPVVSALKARSLHKKYHFDAMWAMMTYMLLPTMLAKSFGVRVPHVLTLQDGDPYKKVFGRMRIVPFISIINKGFRTAGVIQVISRYLASWPEKRGSDSSVVLVRNGANPRDLKEDSSKEDIIAVQKKIGKKDGDVWIVNTSRMVHQKGIDTTIEALTHLPAYVKFLAVGDGVDATKLKELATRLGVADRVVFTGQVDRSEVTLYRKACDIFVAPSRSEGLGNAFVSALASRLPLVTSGVGGIADYAIDGETAWIVHPDDPQALAQKIKEVMDNPEKAHKISEHARSIVENEYDWDKIATQMRERVFNPVLK